MQKPTLLLHTCCACCGVLVAKRLSEHFTVSLFAFNPNIHPEAEYTRRLEDVKRVAANLGLAVIEDTYDPQAWLTHVKGLESEPEGGKRCEACFTMRLARTAQYAKEHGYNLFATTLTTGRNKKAEIINPIGADLARKTGVPFLAKDFKKHGGLDDSMAACEHHGIERQDYCGCVFSRKERAL
jgi:predicted adenine nucleotide alpha hydrolase (AANH) superfamily ATPase